MGNEIFDNLDELPAPLLKTIPATKNQLIQLAGRALDAVGLKDVFGEEWLHLHVGTTPWF